MDIFGWMIPDGAVPYIIVGSAVLFLFLIQIASLRQRRILKGKRNYADARAFRAEMEGLRQRRIAGSVLNVDSAAVLPRRVEAERLQRALQLFNIITTVISVIPLLGAIYALITGQAHVALQLDILGIILTIVTKGGLFLLTMALLPALKAIPAGFGTGFGAWLFNRFMKARESKKRPATQPRDPVAP